MRLIVDTDTAGDDVVSLLMAMHTPGVELLGITINVGNVGFDYQVENALKTVEVAGKAGQVPVFKGAREPLLRPWVSADYVHGQDGMGNAGFAPVSQRPDDKHAVQFLLEASRRYTGDVVIVAQAPLTNLALAVRQDPDFSTRVKELWVMGGSVTGLGNVDPLSEYNFYVDPEAADIVFKAGFNLFMVGWDITLAHGVLSTDDLARIKAMDTLLSRFFLAIHQTAIAFNQTQSIEGTTHPDSLTMALALDRRLWLSVTAYYVGIETQGALTRGTSVVDRLGVWHKRPNAQVCLTADGPAFRDMLLRLLQTGNTGIRLTEPGRDSR